MMEFSRISFLFKKHLGKNLTGVYIHGSLAMGCFHPENSDIDVIILVKQKVPEDAKKSLIKGLLELEKDLPGKGLEVSVILESTLEPFLYPTPFELHFSPYYREKYKSNSQFLCENQTDSDLAAHLNVLYHRGICIYGKPVKKVFKPIEERYYLDSILKDISQATFDINHNSVYFALNLCRTLYYLTDGVIASKEEGGAWALNFLNGHDKNLVEEVLKQYKGFRKKECTHSYTSEEWDVFAEQMLKRIHKAGKDRALL